LRPLLGLRLRLWGTNGYHYVIEASANLRGCRCTEQVTLTRDAGLWKFYDEWLADLVVKHAIRPGDEENPSESRQGDGGEAR